MNIESESCSRYKESRRATVIPFKKKKQRIVCNADARPHTRITMLCSVGLIRGGG